MKYCPFCGATLLGSAASFCAECGKQIPKSPQPEPSEPTTHPEPTQANAPTADKASRKQRGKSIWKKKASRKDQSPPQLDPQDDGYDGYYDDVPPLDNGHEREGLDAETIKKVALIVGGAALIILLSILAMQLL